MEVELILFAKTPLAGQVKTRLIPEIGEHGAAAFAEALIDESVWRAVEAWPGPVRVLVWPDQRHPCFERVADGYGVSVGLQSDGDLGAKMFAALNGAYGRGATGAVMGCDVPQCPAETYRTAHAFLSQGRSVIGPSTDGGYYLVGINPPHPDCFDGIDWGARDVFDATLRRAADAGIDLIVLEELTDLDTMSDIETLRATNPDLVDRLLKNCS